MTLENVLTAMNPVRRVLKKLQNAQVVLKNQIYQARLVIKSALWENMLYLELTNVKLIKFDCYFKFKLLNII